MFYLCNFNLEAQFKNVVYEKSIIIFCHKYDDGNECDGTIESNK